MKINVFNNYDEMSQKTAQFVCDFIKSKPGSLLCFSAGSSPEGTFKSLVKLSGEGAVSFDSSRFVCLDEYLGFDIDAEGGCNNFMYKHLFNPLSISGSNIVYFDACSGDLESECRKVDEYVLKNGPIDLVLAGVGVNGHIGMNEPGISPDLYSHIARLHPVTIDSLKKSFGESSNIDKGITLGMRHLMEAKCVVIIANGIKKAEIIKRIVEGDVTNDVPASLLKTHGSSFLFLDSDAASMLDER